MYSRTVFPPVSSEAKDNGTAFDLGLVVFTMLHIPLAYLMQQYPIVSTGHAIIVAAVGLLVAISKRGSQRVIYVMAYIAGAEILWRMTDASVFWEFGKYATVAIVILAILARRSFPKSGSPLLFFALLLPSIAITITTVSLSDARALISFNLSGALSLAACAVFCYGLPLSNRQTKNIKMLFIAPVYGIFSLALSGTLSAPVEIFLSGESSFLTSGGYGPNQVSAILGLGALLALLYLLLLKPPLLLKIFLTITIVAFISQAALTFSRGGVYIFGVSMLAAMFFIYREPRQRLSITLAVLFFVILGYFLLPRLNQFTLGGLSARYTDISTTGRYELAQEEITTFLRHPFFGVGPGISAYMHAISGAQLRVASHNEFTRLLAEHGVFGLLSLFFLIYIAIRNYRQASSHAGQAIAAALIVWTFASMGYTALRLVAPALMFGLSGAQMLTVRTDNPSQAEENANLGTTGLDLPKPSFHHRITYRS